MISCSAKQGEECMRKVLMMFVVVVCGSVGVMAQDSATSSRSMELFSRRVTPLMISVVDPVQIPQYTWDVMGLRINLIYGSCHTMTGLDIGLVNSCERLRGLQIGIVNTVDLMKGLQIGVVNHANRAVGVQIGLINIISENDIPFLPVINGYF